MNTINRVARWRIVFDWNFLKCVLFCSFYLPVPDGDKWHAIVTTQGMKLKCDQRRHVQDCKRERRMCESYVQSAVQSADVSPPSSSTLRLQPAPPPPTLSQYSIQTVRTYFEIGWMMGWGGDPASLFIMTAKGLPVGASFYCNFHEMTKFIFPSQ